jgi:integrase
LRGFRPADVAACVASTSGGSSTINRDLATLHAILGSAQRAELIDENPASRAERPKPERRRWRILEPVEIGAVARELEGQDRVIFLTLVLTGLRREELRALRWRDIDLVEKVLRVVDAKTEDGVRSIALAPQLAETLWQQRRTTPLQGEDEFVFT